MKQKVLSLASFIAFLGLVSCNAGKNQTNIELVQQMMDQSSVKFQDWDPTAKGNLAMRVPPKNTIPRGYKPYAYKGDPEGG
jgi:hypothetical protein